MQSRSLFVIRDCKMVIFRTSAYCDGSGGVTGWLELYRFLALIAVYRDSCYKYRTVN